LGRFLCLSAETSPRVVRQVGVVVDHPPRLLAVVGLQGGERAGPRLQAARLLDECLSSRPIFRPRAVWRSSAWSGISRRGTLSLSSCQTAQSTRPTSARSPARSARGRRTEARALWSCPGFDDAWTLQVASRGKGGSGAENEAAVSGGVPSGGDQAVRSPEAAGLRRIAEATGALRWLREPRRWGRICGVRRTFLAVASKRVGWPPAAPGTHTINLNP
jgi:hypothetical protein